MEVVNSIKMTSIDNWNVKSLDVSSLKMNIDNNKMDVIITSPNFTQKNYQLEIDKGELSVKIIPESSPQHLYESRFALPYSDYKNISHQTFVKGKLKVTLTKKGAKKKSKKTKYNNVA